MKVVIQGVETCGIIADLAAEMTNQGHDVVTIADPNVYYDVQYDHRLTWILHDAVQRRWLPQSLTNVFAGGLYRFAPRIYHALASKLRERICCEADFYVQIWSGWHGEYQLLENLHRRGIKIATLFMGSDVRYYPCFQQQYQETDWEFPDQYAATLPDKLTRLRTHERLSDAIFSVPDQMGLAVRPYHHLVVPISYSNIECLVPGRDRPLVIHAPTNVGVKGSTVIESALAQLRNEGCPFDYLPLTKIPHSSLLKILTVADVLVDEVLLHGPGWLGFEAMAAGCAVATRYLQDSPAIFRPPVHAIDRRTIVDQLRLLLTDRALRVDLAARGRRYVEQNNSVTKAVNHLFARVFGPPGQEDYSPTYINEYCRGSSQDADLARRSFPNGEQTSVYGAELLSASSTS